MTAPPNIHATPENARGGCTLPPHIHLMPLNIVKNEIVKKGLILNSIFTGGNEQILR